MTDKDFAKAVKTVFLKDGSLEEGKVIKSLPANKDEIKAFKQYDKEMDEAIQRMIDLKYDGQKLWAGIKLRLDLFGDLNLQFNDKSNEIEVLEIKD